MVGLMAGVLILALAACKPNNEKASIVFPKDTPIIVTNKWVLMRRAGKAVKFTDSTTQGVPQEYLDRIDGCLEKETK